MQAPSRGWNYAILGVILLVSLLALGYVYSLKADACPVVDQMPSYLQNAADVVDGLVGLGLSVSITLVGLAAAFLIGIRTLPNETFVSRNALITASIMFANAALYAVWWRIELAESWFNDCVSLVFGPFMKGQIYAHTLFFVLGILCLVVILVEKLYAGGNDEVGDPK